MTDSRICKVCDGGPGNEGICLCGARAYEDSATLSAAPKAEPTQWLADRAADILLNSYPEAPKAEPEPFGYAYETIGGYWSLRPVASIGDTHGKPLYTHPAPSSDASVISYEEAHATAVEMGYQSLTEALEDLERLQKDRDAFDSLGDTSDELLEALEVIEGVCKFVDDRGPTGEGWQSPELENAWSVVRNHLAKHKGPQS